MRLPGGIVVMIKSTLGVIVIVVAATIGGLIGCSLAADRVLPAPLESRVASNGNADDHMTAAMLYQQEAQRRAAEVIQYEQEAAAIQPIEDPKGFRRSGLLTAAHSSRAQAADMLQLYAEHYTKAQTLTGKQPPQ